MKAKFDITLPEINVQEKGKNVRVLGGGKIATDVEFAPAEIKDMYEMQKGMLKELPELLRAFAVDLCREYVKGKEEAMTELMKDEDFRAQREESQRISEQIAATSEMLKQGSCINKEDINIEQ